jgi:hypothetical protein
MASDTTVRELKGRHLVEVSRLERENASLVKYLTMVDSLIRGRHELNGDVVIAIDMVVSAALKEVRAS